MPSVLMHCHCLTGKLLFNEQDHQACNALCPMLYVSCCSVPSTVTTKGHVSPGGYVQGSHVHMPEISLRLLAWRSWLCSCSVWVLRRSESLRHSACCEAVALPAQLHPSC